MLLIFAQHISLAQNLIEKSKNLPEALRQEAKSLSSNSEYQWPVNDIRIRIFGSDDLRAIIDEENKNFNVNNINEELFLLQSTIRQEKITITYNRDGNSRRINWDPSGIGDVRFRMLNFIILINNNQDLDYQLNADPTTLLIVPSSSMLNISISYEHTLIFNDTQTKQERIEQKCLVDSDNILALPVFYESINSNADPAIRDSDSGIWFDAQSNSYKLSVAGLTYYEVEKKIADFYNTRIGEDAQVSDITVRILPEKHFSTVQVHYKRRCYELNYQNLDFGAFFSDEYIRAMIRLRKKILKGVILTRPNTLGTDRKRVARYHPRRTFKKERLYPGDIIYLK